MAELRNEQKKALARDIYLLGSYTLEEIAAKVGSTRQTVSRWAREGGWEEMKAGMTVGREQILKNLYRQISEINKGERHATSREADTIMKLSAAIRKLEDDIGIGELISAGMRFGDWLRPLDLAKAKEFVNLYDAFLKDQVR